jgi:hypothetical protein
MKALCSSDTLIKVLPVSTEVLPVSTEDELLVQDLGLFECQDVWVCKWPVRHILRVSEII